MNLIWKYHGDDLVPFPRHDVVAQRTALRLLLPLVEAALREPQADPDGTLKAYLEHPGNIVFLKQHQYLRTPIKYGTNDWKEVEKLYQAVHTVELKRELVEEYNETIEEEEVDDKEHETVPNLVQAASLGLRHNFHSRMRQIYGLTSLDSRGRGVFGGRN